MTGFMDIEVDEMLCTGTKVDKNGARYYCKEESQVIYKGDSLCLECYEKEKNPWDV